ncbi:poly(R)-hydroxyalkanoic acid synthase subunit PhaE [Hymenobacter glacieicola]|uniref:Poly(3-hydroxyalkanoate) polymerase subunit PhaE n=1 Tax=Hymenobacter glacieicola TaxID=1562124 RepID=A0ABQ1WSU8_9BACT|nr:poly(R)-hydroxyalkanoic acid synthase subunit PhaE [Hymenobacter glacieicola]GGG42104.1 hypothetical protein GCM10011378_18060 [Hymenobacter glacieicola]
MEQTVTFFDTWYNSTTKLVNDWREATEKLSGEQKSMWEEAGKMQQNWMHSFQTMMQNMQLPFMGGSGTSSPFAHTGMQDAFFNMLKSTDIYTRLFQLWQPVLQAMQHNTCQSQDFWKLIDQQGFKTFVDKLFGFDAVTPVRAFMDQSTQMMKLWMDSATEASKSFGPMFGNSMPFFGSFAQLNPQSLTQWYMQMAQTAQRSFAPFWGSTDKGQMPSLQSVVEMMQQWGNYMAKVNQLQTMLYKQSVSAWEKVMQTMADRAREGNVPTDFNQFYNEWSAINEAEFVALFNTDEYAALQGELIKLNSELTKAYEKQMEVFLQPYPVVLRSQLDEVYKVNHELRGRINTLEKLVSELQSNQSNKPETSAPQNQSEIKTSSAEENKPGRKENK